MWHLQVDGHNFRLFRATPRRFNLLIWVLEGANQDQIQTEEYDSDKETNDLKLEYLV